MFEKLVLTHTHENAFNFLMALVLWLLRLQLEATTFMRVMGHTVFITPVAEQDK